MDERGDGVAAANVCFYGVETRRGLGRDGAGDSVEFFEDVLGARTVVCIIDHLSSDQGWMILPGLERHTTLKSGAKTRAMAAPRPAVPAVIRATFCVAIDKMKASS